MNAILPIVDQTSGVPTDQQLIDEYGCFSVAFARDDQNCTSMCGYTERCVTRMGKQTIPTTRRELANGGDPTRISLAAIAAELSTDEESIAIAEKVAAGKALKDLLAAETALPALQAITEVAAEPIEAAPPQPEPLEEAPVGVVAPKKKLAKVEVPAEEPQEVAPPQAPPVQEKTVPEATTTTHPTRKKLPAKLEAERVRQQDFPKTEDEGREQFDRERRKSPAIGKLKDGTVLPARRLSDGVLVEGVRVDLTERCYWWLGRKWSRLTAIMLEAAGVREFSGKRISPSFSTAGFFRLGDGMKAKAQKRSPARKRVSASARRPQKKKPLAKKSRASKKTKAGRKK